MKAYEMAVLRYRPDAFSGEFVNVGILMVCRSPEAQKPIEIKFEIESRIPRLSNFFHAIWDAKSFNMWRRDILQRVDAFLKSSKMSPSSAAQLKMDEICQDIHAHNGNAFFWSDAMPGVTDDFKATFDEVFQDMVSRHIPEHSSNTISDKVFWEDCEPRIRQILAPKLNVHGLFRFGETPTTKASHRMHMEWRNGTSQFLEPLSFEVAEAETIAAKSQRITGKLHQIHDMTGREFKCTVLIATPTSKELVEVADEHKDIISKSKFIRRVITNDELQPFLEEVMAEAKPIV